MKNEHGKYKKKDVEGTCEDLLNMEGLSKTSDVSAKECDGNIRRRKITHDSISLLDGIEIECL